MKIGLITCEEKRELDGEDILLLDAIRNTKNQCEPIAWSEMNDDVLKFDSLIIRSVWDYHHRIDEFTKWLNWIEANQVKLYNEVEVVRFNIDKNYLKFFSNLGFKIVPSIFQKANSKIELDPYFCYFNTDEIILKPTISASAHNLIKISKDKIGDFQDKINKVIKADYIIQPFIKEIYNIGETSLVFYDKKYSHAVSKIPKSGEFRVQGDFGGTYEYLSPDKWIIEYASKIVLSIPYELLYARIDCIVLDNEFMLMEVELIEPVLYNEKKEYRDKFVESILKISAHNGVCN